jgi:hypothetical protein
MPATDRVLQVGNANFASPVPSATKFTQKKISAWAKLSPPPPPADEFATPPEPTRVASAPLPTPTRVASAPLTGSRRVANFCATPQEPSREASPGVASARVASARAASTPQSGGSLADSTPRVRTLASLAEAELAALLTPRQVQAVLISGVEVVSHLDEKPFALYQLVAPLLSGEHVAFRRYSEFVRLDRTLRAAWGLPTHRALCSGGAGELPALPPKTAFWQDATSTAVTSHRWGALQLWLDVVLDRLSQGVYNEKAWDAFRQFLGVPW